MSGLILKETAAASVPTPASGKATVFVDSADGLPKYKDDAGATHSLKGDPGTNVPSIVSTVTSNTITPTGTTDLVRPPALTAGLTVANPSSTPADGWPIVFELKDNGTARALTWGSKYANRISALPATTVAGKQHVVVVSYNAADDKLYCDMAVVQA